MLSDERPRFLRDEMRWAVEASKRERGQVGVKCRVRKREEGVEGAGGRKSWSAKTQKKKNAKKKKKKSRLALRIEYLTEEVGTGPSGGGRDRERASSRAVFGGMTGEEGGGRTFSSFFLPALMRGPATTGPRPPPRSLLTMFFMACIYFRQSARGAPLHSTGVRSLRPAPLVLLVTPL